MATTIQSSSTEQLRMFTDFARTLVIKIQEEADYYETEAVAKAGITYNGSAVTETRNWAQIVAYINPTNSDVVTKKSAAWIFRNSSSVATSYAKDDDGALWEQLSATSWLNASTGAIRTAPYSTWPLLSVPAGECYVDGTGVNFRVLLPHLIWFDSTSGETSLLGPEDSNFIGASGASTTHPDGLSDLIPTSQDYVSAKIKLSVGGLTPAEEIALTAAVASFEEYGEWEDTRQPYYITNSSGALVLDSNGLPITNQLRIVQTKYRGELNTYYRRLVRDYDISPFDSRTAGQFEVITWDLNSGISDTEARTFVATHAECIRVFKTAFYNQALENDALYYKYCRMFIAWMAIIKTINQTMNGLSDIDHMNSYDITNLLYSFGIYSFDDMPIIYRRRLAKNLEKILSVKGTTQAFKDILGLFNLNNDINIWKHYLVKYFPHKQVLATFTRELADGERYRIVFDNSVEVIASTATELCDSAASTLTGFRSCKFANNTFTLQRYPDTSIGFSLFEIIDSNSISLESANFELGSTDYGLPEVGFHKVDIDDPVAETTIGNTDTAYLSSYKEFVSSDQTWETTEAEARNLAFSTLQTKYFSVSSAIDAVHNGMALALLWAMLKDAQARGRTSAMLVENANTLDGVVNMNIFEAFVATLILTLWRFGVEDIIPHNESGVSTIIAARTDGAAFPNEGNLLPYSVVLGRVADQPDPLESQRVMGLNDQNIMIAEKIDISLNEAGHADTLGIDPKLGGEEARAYNYASSLKNMWDHKFIGKYHSECFGASETYITWLDYQNVELAAWIRSIDANSDYINGIMSLTLLIEDTIHSDNLNLPVALGMNDIVMTYMERLIRFFKAYTTDLRNFSTFLLIDRPASESLRLMNLLAGLKISFSRDDEFDMSDFYETFWTWAVSDTTNFEDVIDALVQLDEQDIARIIDGIPSWAQDQLKVSPAAVMRDVVSIKTKFAKRDAVTVTTRNQRKDDISVYQSTDSYGLTLSYTSTSTATSTLLDPMLIDDVQGTLLSAYLETSDIAVTTSKLRIRQGLGEGVLIIPH